MKFLKGHKDLLLIKLFSFNSISVVVRSVLGLISQKLIAVFLGPDGIALLGNLRNALSLFGMSASAGIDQGVLKYQSEFENEPQVLKKLYTTSTAFSVLGCLITFLVLFFGADFWSTYLFGTSAHSFLFIILSFSLPFMALYNLCLSVLSGAFDYKKATIISLVSYVIIACFILVLVVFYKLSGALMAVVLTPAIQFLVLLFFARKQIGLFLNFEISFDKFFKNKLLVFIVMSFAAVILGNVVELELRNHLIKKLSINEAGYWTSIMSLSNYYLSFMTGVYSLYVLPQFAKIKSLEVFKAELFKIYKFVIPVFSICFIGIFLFRFLIIKLLYSDEFLPMGALFKWQLLGDLVKIISVVLAYQFIAQKKWMLFIIIETISCVLFYVFGVYFIDKIGVEGVVFAHFLRYIFYLIIIMFTIKYSFETNDKANGNIY